MKEKQMEKIYTHQIMKREKNNKKLDMNDEERSDCKDSDL